MEIVGQVVGVAGATAQHDQHDGQTDQPDASHDTTAPAPDFAGAPAGPPAFLRAVHLFPESGQTGLVGNGAAAGASVGALIAPGALVAPALLSAVPVGGP